MRTELEPGVHLSAFLEQEQANAEARKRTAQKKSIRYMCIAPPICIIGTYLLGVWVLHGDFIQALGHFKYGFIIAVFVDLCFILADFCMNSSKRYMKSLKKQLLNALPDPGTREAFAAQMLGTQGKDSVRHIRYMLERKEESASFTQDYGIMRYNFEATLIVRLKDVERIELDKTQFIIPITSGEKIGQLKSTEYPIFFFYRKEEVSAKKKDADVVFFFPSRQIREQAVQAIRELTSNK